MARDIVPLLSRRTKAPHLAPEQIFARTGISQFAQSVRDQNIEEIDISHLREAIRANWVSFPSQVPTFSHCGPSELQWRAVQLYFILGWRGAAIAARYGMGQDQVRHMLNAWKLRAVRAGFIQLTWVDHKFSENIFTDSNPLNSPEQRPTTQPALP